MKKLIGSILILAVSMPFIVYGGEVKKEIESRNIVEFFTSFFIFDKYEAGNDGTFLIGIKDNDEGEHVLTVNGVYDHELVVGDEVLAGVQDIIDKYELEKNNGANKVTAGLPPEYSPWELNVLYDSGEELSFYENGTPDAEWTGAFRDYFVRVMAEAGYKDVLPPKEAITIVNFSTAFGKDGTAHYYGEIAVPLDNGEEVYFFHIAEDMEQEEILQEEYAEITDTLLEGLQNVIEENNMSFLHAPETVHFNLLPSPDGFLELYVDYENGRQIYCEYNTEELPEEWPVMRDALMEYLDQYIEEHKISL